MNNIHMALQGKGGVGKSLISYLLAQYLAQEEKPVACFDTDPVNRTLSNYSSLNTKHINLLNGSRVNERNFDELMEDIIALKNTNVVIDNGASSFIPLSNYLIENSVFDLLTEQGHPLYFHMIISGGEALLDTLNGFDAIAKQIKDVKIIVWLNEYFGSVEMEGKKFKEMKTYLNNKEKVKGIIQLDSRNPDTIGKDIETLTKLHLTFAEAEKSSDFNIMAKQRLITFRNDVFSQLDGIKF